MISKMVCVGMKEETYNLNWSQYNWRDFEKICFEYIKECYSAKFYKTILTRAHKDQGRDIIIKGRYNKFEAWGECKYHKRNINLSTIGKNIVLALSHQINKAIFFSVTSITLNTKIEILNIARLHGFEVLFLDGYELNKSILSCHKVSHKYFRKEYEKYVLKNSNPLWIDVYLSEYPFAEDAKNTSKQQYHLENGFQIFMHLFIKNVSNKDISDLHIELDSISNNDIIFYDTNFKHNTLITSHTDLMHTFQGLVFSPKRNIEIPHVKINYSILEGKCIQENIAPGTIDASDIWRAPYVNSDSAKFLHDAHDILKDVIPKKYVRILFLYGKSGMGKSRLMGEIENKGYEHCYKVIHVDFREKEEFQAMHDLFFSLLSLPISKHKIFLNFSDFQTTFNNKISNEYLTVLYNFLYKENTKVIYGKLTDAAIELLIFASEREHLLIGIDNIQELSYDLQIFFWKVLERCKELNVSVCFLFSQNTERFTNSKHVLVNYLNLCGDRRENYILSYECDLLKQDDAVTLMQQLLRLPSENKELIEDILGTDGTSPMDILLLSKTLSQSKGLFNRIDEYQYINNPTIFSEKTSVLSASTNMIIENRLDNLKEINNGSMEVYMELFSCITFFDGNLPMEIFEKCDFDKEKLCLSNQNLLTKINYNENIITFYHEKIFSYWKEKQTSISLQKLQIIYNYYIEKQNDNFVNSYFFLKSLVALKKNNEAIDTGLILLEKYKKNNQNIYVCKTSDILLQLLNRTQQPIEYFNVLFQKADFLLERVNISEAEDVFEEAKQIINIKYTMFTEKDVVHFFHKYINQKLHTNQYTKALDALQEFEKINSSRSDTPLIINDRYCVALYSLGKESEALERINKVIKASEENRNNIWLSIAYSDKAFTYYFNSRDTKQVLINFSEAIKYYHLDNDSEDISRKIEIYIQETIIHIIEENDESAMKSIQQALQIVEEANYGYLQIPAINVNAYLLLKKNDIDNALSILEKALSYAITFSNTKALISIYNNIGNIYLLKKMPQEALGFYLAAFNILQEICLPQNSIRYIGLLCNLIKVHMLFDKQSLVLKELSKYKFQVLEEYAVQCQDTLKNGKDILSFYYGVLGYKGYDYLI